MTVNWREIPESKAKLSTLMKDFYLPRQLSNWSDKNDFGRRNFVDRGPPSTGLQHWHYFSKTLLRGQLIWEEISSYLNGEGKKGTSQK